MIRLFLWPAGRIDRRRFWLGWLPFMAVTMIAGWFLFPIMGSRDPVLHGVWLAAQIYPLACLYSKRIHDLGWSGWLPVPVLAFQAFAEWVSSRQVDTVLETMRETGAQTIETTNRVDFPWALIAWVASIALLAVAGLIPGAPGRNQHGDPPGKPSAEEAFE